MFFGLRSIPTYITRLFCFNVRRRYRIEPAATERAVALDPQKSCQNPRKPNNKKIRLLSLDKDVV